MGTTETQHDNETPQARWRDIFAFTRRRHVPILVLAVISTILAAGTQALNAMFLGFLFQAVTDFGSGELGADDAKAEVVKWCLILCAVAAGNGLGFVGFLGFWTTFGELQAKEIRSMLAKSLIDREMDWFDTRQDGISSMLARMRT